VRETELNIKGSRQRALQSHVRKARPL